MNKNTLEERNNNLATVDYPPLLKEILTILKRQENIFYAEASCLKVDIDRIAIAVVQQLQPSKFKGLLPFTHTKGTQFAAANFTDGEAIKEFRVQIERIKEQLQAFLTTALQESAQDKTIEAYSTSLLSDASAFEGGTAGLHFAFGKETVQKQRLHLHPKAKRGSGATTRLRGHILTIIVKNIHSFDADLIEGLCNKLRDSCDCTERQIEGVQEVLKRRIQDRTRELGILKRIVYRESLGRLQKEAKVRYLEYLGKTMSGGKGQTGDGLLYLQSLVKRLRRLEAFINDGSKADGYYQVSYGGDFGANLRDVFSRADAFDVLPIITEIEGSLGETFNGEKGEKVFTTGVKLKLNGPFQGYDSVFAYYLTLLDPDSEEHQKRKTSSLYSNQHFVEKVLKIALLYYFVFKNMNDKDYDPALDVEKDLLKILRGDDEAAKVKTLRGFKKGLSQTKYSDALVALKTTLEEFIKKIGSDFGTESYPLHLSVDDGIVEVDCSRMLIEKEFLQSEALQEKGMKALKYISIQEPTAEGDALCVLPVTLTFEPMYFAPAQEPARTFTMQYDTRTYEMLPVLFVPNEQSCKQTCETSYKDYKRIVLYYQSRLPFKPDSQEAFVYRFTFLLLSYLCLKLLFDSVRRGLVERKKRLFIPLVRIHLTQKAEHEKENLTNEENVLNAFSKVLAHMLSEEHSAHAQGFYIGVLRGEKGAGYKLSNGLCSLYNILPKAFTLDTSPTLDKLAIILVSSRRCDAHQNSQTYLSNIYGEVIGMQRYSTGKVQVVTLNTFSANEESDKIYRTPTVILDEAKKCYERGYRHILYVAKAPYSSTLHITSAEKGDEQFFMSKDIIQALKDGKSDLHIYPIYCDKYYVVKVGTDQQKAESLYVDDTSELRTLVTDPNRSSVVFFNLLNGITVGTGGKASRVYNGVVSYATLVNVYDDPTYDQTIRNNLLDGTQAGSLKRDILDFLTLLHFSRFEKDKKVSFKLDPYENIIGSESVGSLSFFTHMISSVRFNALAFLTEVRSVLNRRYSGYTAALLQADEEMPSQ